MLVLVVSVRGYDSPSHEYEQQTAAMIGDDDDRRHCLCCRCSYPDFFWSVVPNHRHPKSSRHTTSTKRARQRWQSGTSSRAHEAVVDAGRCEAGAAHCIRVALERPDKLPSPRIPDLGGSWQGPALNETHVTRFPPHNAPRTVVGAAHDPGPIRREGSRGHRVSMLQLQSEGQSPGQIPDLRNVVDASRDRTAAPLPCLQGLSSTLLTCGNRSHRRSRPKQTQPTQPLKRSCSQRRGWRHPEKKPRRPLADSVRQRFRASMFSAALLRLLIRARETSSAATRVGLAATRVWGKNVERG